MKLIIEKAKKTNNLTKEEIIELLSNESSMLFLEADKIRESYKGNAVHLRGLIEFTNTCKQNCFYCGLRCSNKKIERYRMSLSEIMECALEAKKAGLKTIVLQGGEDDYYNTDKIIKIIKEIKKYDFALTLSIGEKTYDEYKAFKEAGADRYLLRIETTNKSLYSDLHPNMSYENRVNCIENLKSLGYETGTGSLVGLPNQCLDSIASDILFFKKINADMIGIGPFIPHPDTPLSKYKSLNNFSLSLKIIAIIRLLMPDINIPATTAMETLNKNGRIMALQSGANVIMPNITPIKYKNKYELYPGKTKSLESAYTIIRSIENMVFSINRTISQNKGYRQD